MANVKIVLRKNMMKKDKTIPLALRISENYRTNYRWLGQYVLEKDWDAVNCKVKGSHPNHKQINNFLLKKVVEVNNIYFDDSNLTTRQVKQKLKGAGGGYSFFSVAVDRLQEKYDRGVFAVANAELSILYNLEEFLNLKTSVSKKQAIEAIKKRRNERMVESRRTPNSYIKNLKYFKQNDRLRFQDINERFLDKFKTFCTAYLGHKTRTITNHLIFIRTLFNRAIKDGIVDSKYYPFAGDKEKIRIGSGNKIGLTIEEIGAIENLDLDKHSSIGYTRNVWLIAFYFAGVRISDVVQLRWSDFKDDRLFYVMHKNEKPLSLKVPDKAAAILALYKSDKEFNNGFVFPFLKEADLNNAEDVFVKMRNATSLFNKYLKRIAAECKIEKNLSNHIARHSFGNIAGDRIHPLMLQKLYRHSDLKTTLNYQANFIHRDADDALDQVINF